DVLCERGRVAAYRASGAPIGTGAVERCVAELARELRIDPVKLREINGAKEGTKATHGPTWVNPGRTVRRLGAFLGAVDLAQFERIDAELPGELGDAAFDRAGTDRRPGRPVGGDPTALAQHV